MKRGGGGQINETLHVENMRLFVKITGKVNCQKGPAHLYLQLNMSFTKKEENFFSRIQVDKNYNLILDVYFS